MARPLALLALSAGLAHGQSTFEAATPLALAISGPSDVELADLDGDGDLDAALTSVVQRTVSVCWNQGGGLFSAPVALHQGRSAMHRVLARDLDGDGLPELVFAGGSVGLLRNLGAGSFGAAEPVDPSGVSIWTLDLGDLDGDGDLDLATGAWWSHEVAWLENLGGGTFGPRRTLTQAVLGVSDVRVRDFDGDGDGDLLSVASWGGQVLLHRRVGAGFDPPMPLFSGLAQPRSVDLGDVDGDGQEDLLVGLYGGEVHWRRGLANGGFTPRAVLEEDAAGLVRVRLVDLDLDGDLDALSAAEFADRITWYENLLGDLKGPRLLADPCDGAWAFSVGDLDGDGLLDVAHAVRGLDRVDWSRNLGPLDCDGNGLVDRDEIDQDATLDWDGDAALDKCQAGLACAATPNSSGLRATLAPAGSPLLADDQFGLQAAGLPPGRVGFALVASEGGSTLAWGGAPARLCLAGSIARLVGPGQVVVSDAAGAAGASYLPSSGLPLGTPVQPGTSLWFQWWFRDTDPQTGAQVSGTSDSALVLFR